MYSGFIKVFVVVVVGGENSRVLRRVNESGESEVNITAVAEKNQNNELKDASSIS